MVTPTDPCAFKRVKSTKLIILGELAALQPQPRTFAQAVAAANARTLSEREAEEKSKADKAPTPP